LIRARDLMLWGDFRHRPVVEGDRVVGILSDRDVAAHQARTGESLISSPDDTVSMAMETVIQTASPEDTVSEAALRMAAAKIGCLPVLTDGKLVGIVTTTDVLACQGRPVVAGLADMCLADVMTRMPVTVHPDDSLLDAADRMNTRGIRHLPVIDAERLVVGMLSDRDIRTALGDPKLVFDGTARRKAAERIRVQDVMSSPVATARPERRCSAAVDIFIDQTVSAIPIVDRSDRLIGIVSYIDILRSWIEPSTPADADG
jgi:CBS domain-containing protein